MLFIERSSWRKLRAVSGRKINKQWNNSKDFRSISVFCVLGLFMCLCSMCDCGCGCGMWLFASITPRKFKCHEAKLRDCFDWCYNSRAFITTVCIVINYCYYNGWWLSICCQWVIYGCSPHKPKLYITTTTTICELYSCYGLLASASANMNE